MPRSLFTTSVASASPSTSSAMISSGLPALETASRIGTRFLAARNLFLVHENQAVFELDFLLVLIGDEVGREEAAIELHAFDDFDRRLAAAAFVDGDDAVFADLGERVGQHVADRGVVVARDRGDLLQALLVFDVDRLGLLVDGFVDGLHGLVDAAAEGHRIGAGGDHLEAFAEDAFGKHGGGRGAVAGDVARLAGGFLDELSAEVFERVIEFDILGDGDAVFGHLGGAPTFIEHGVAAAGAERAADGPGQLFDAGRQGGPGVIIKQHLFCCHATILRSFFG